MEENKDNVNIDDLLSNIAQSNDAILNSTESPNLVTYKQDYIGMLKDIQLNVSIVLGIAEIPLKKVLDLNSQSVLELDRNVDEDVDIYINDRLLAKGQIVALEAEYGVKITQKLNRPLQDGSLEEIPNDN